MNAFKFVVLALSFVSLQAHATTAVLCGDLEKIEESDDEAVVHLIFEDLESISKDLRMYSKGKTVKFKSVSVTPQTVTIELKDGRSVLRFPAKSVDYSYCQGEEEDRFVMEHINGAKKTVIKDCQCWQG